MYAVCGMVPWSTSVSDEVTSIAPLILADRKRLYIENERFIDERLSDLFEISLVSSLIYSLYLTVQRSELIMHNPHILAWSSLGR